MSDVNGDGANRDSDVEPTPTDPKATRRWVTAVARVAPAIGGVSAVAAAIAAVWNLLSDDDGPVVYSGAVHDVAIIVAMTVLVVTLSGAAATRARRSSVSDIVVVIVGTCAVVSTVGVTRYLDAARETDEGHSLTTFGFYLACAAGLFAVAGHSARLATGTAADAKNSIRSTLVSTAVGGAVTSVVLTAVALVNAKPATLRDVDTSDITGAVALSFGVAVGVGIVAAAVFALTRRRGEISGIVSATAALVGGPTLLWLTALHAPAELGEATSRLLGPGTHGYTPVALVGVIAAAATGVAVVGLVLEAFHRGDETVRTWSPGTAAVSVIVVGLIGTSTAVTLQLHETNATTVTTAADSEGLERPISFGRFTFRVDLRDHAARAVVPTGNGFAVYDRSTLTAYDGRTGSRRWAIDLDLLDREIPGHNNYSGNDTDRLLLANGSGTTSSVTIVGANNRIVTLDGITGTVLWSSTDEITLFSASGRAAERNALVGVRRFPSRSDVVSLDPRTGRTLWTKPVSRHCNAIGDIIGTTVAMTDNCTRRGQVVLVDAKTGAERKPIRIDDDHGLITAEGEMFAVNPPSAAAGTTAVRTTVIDPKSARVVDSVGTDGIQSPIRNGNYLSVNAQRSAELRSVITGTGSPRQYYANLLYQRTRAVRIGDDRIVAIGRPRDDESGPKLMDAFLPIPNGYGLANNPCSDSREPEELATVPGSLLVLCRDANVRGFSEIVGAPQLR